MLDVVLVPFSIERHISHRGDCAVQPPDARPFAEHASETTFVDVQDMLGHVRRASRGGCHAAKPVSLATGRCAERWSWRGPQVGLAHTGDEAPDRDEIRLGK